MGSVIVTWKGQCPDRDVQSELLALLRRLALHHEARWAQTPSPRPRFVDLIAGHRSEGLPTRPTVRFFDQVLTGRILVCTDVSEDAPALAKEATRRGLSQDPGSPHALLHLEHLQVRGLDFQLFDPRALYPGEDRMSFFFLESEDLPALNGRLAAVQERAMCALSRVESIRAADWYVECPYVHLRYYLEDWIDGLLAWIKFFFIPGLYYRRYETLSGYGAFQHMLDMLQASEGYPQARALFLEALLAGFEQEADQWNTQLKSWTNQPTIDSVRLVIPDWEQLFADEHTCVWQNDDGDGLSIHFHTQPPAFAASLDDLEAVRAAVRAEATQAGAGIVEVDVISLDDLPVVRSIVKKPQQPSGMTYEGSLLLLRRDCSAALKVLCREHGVTGLRDAAVFLRVTAGHDEPLDLPWFQDPYDPLFEGLVLRNPADDPEWDDRFPQHPLSRCRTHLQMIAGKVSFKADLKEASAFSGAA